MRSCCAAAIAVWLTLNAAFAEELPDDTVRTYPVADLVVEVLDQDVNQTQLQVAGVEIQSLSGNETRQQSAVSRNLDELAEVIQTTTVPDQWENTGGTGRIIGHQNTFSLIVRQSAAGHAEIEDLLQNLRELNSIRVAVKIDYIETASLEQLPRSTMQVQCAECARIGGLTPAGAQFETVLSEVVVDPASPPPQFPAAGHGILLSELEPSQQSPKQAFDSLLKGAARKYGRSMSTSEHARFCTDIRKYAEIETLYEGVVANGSKRMMTLGYGTSIVSPDRKSVDFHLTLPLDHACVTSSVRLPSNDTSFLRIETGGNEPVMLLVSATVLEPEDEEHGEEE